MRQLAEHIATRASAALRALSVGAVLALGVAPAVLADATQPTLLIGDIPAQPLAAALDAFARQTGLHVVYVSKVVRDKSSRAVSAGVGADAALAGLLQGTGLGFEFLTPKSVRILAAELGPATRAPAPAGESSASLPAVYVTGSRIPVPASITATSPMQIVSAQELMLAGHIDTVDAVSSMAQMVTTASADFGNHSNPSASAGGFTTADLRGLRPQRTVILINGRRLGLGDPNTANPTPAPDLDQIPLAMIERVEVLTGGASATYGSDAVAGVVNFILKDHLEGVQVEGQYGFADHTQHNDYVEGREVAAGFTAPSGRATDGVRRDLSVLAGTDFHDGDGHVSGYFTYHGQDAVPGSARDYTSCTAVSANLLSGVVTDRGYTCLTDLQSNLFVPGAGAGAGVGYAVVGNQFVPWPAAGAVPPSAYNPAAFWSTQREDARYQAGMLAHLELTPRARPYLELSFMEDRTQTSLSPSGLFIGANTLTADGSYLVNCSNPLLSAEQAALLCTPAEIAADRAHPGTVSAALDIARRNIEGGNRRSSYEHRNYRAVAGVDGHLGDGWSYDAYALYYYTSLFQTYQNFFSIAASDQALQVTTDPAGRPACISGGSCVPYNIFSSGGVTAQQLAYLTGVGTDAGSNSEQIVAADLTGQLGRYGLVMPWAHDGAAINAGAEHRGESLRFAPDAVEQSGDLSGFGNPAVAIDKRVAVDDGFVELRVPIVQDRPLAKDLTFDAGYRYSVYSTAGASNTYKAGLQFAPIADLRLRGSYDRVVRAPNLIELYTPLAYGGSPVIDNDPCAPTDGGATHAAASLAECMRTGVSAAQYGNGIGPASGGTSKIAQCSLGCGVVTGGNPSLVPETADTWSLGVTLTPAALPALTGSVDYFHIRLRGEIGAVPATVTLQQCLATGDPILCSQIVRTRAGALSGATVAGGGYILATAANTGAALVSGIDVQLNARQPLAGRWGTLTASLSGSWLQHNAATPYRTAPSYDCAGLFGDTCLGGSVNPSWRHNLRVTWDTPWQLQLSAQWRFIGRTGYDNNSTQAVLQNREEGFFDPLLTHIPSWSYLDLSAVWAVTGHLQLRVGASNVLDKDPPFVPLQVSVQAGALNTFPTYDVLGRNVFMALRATF